MNGSTAHEEICCRVRLRASYGGMPFFLASTRLRSMRGRTSSHSGGHDVEYLERGGGLHFCQEWGRPLNSAIEESKNNLPQHEGICRITVNWRSLRAYHIQSICLQVQSQRGDSCATAKSLILGDVRNAPVAGLSVAWCCLQ